MYILCNVCYTMICSVRDEISYNNILMELIVICDCSKLKAVSGELSLIDKFYI